MGQRLDDKTVRELAVPAKGNRVTYDAPSKRGNDYTAGFGVRITANGARSFILNYRRKDGKERRHTLGAYGAWTLLAAREEAKRLKRHIDGGGDPVGEVQKLRGAPVVRDLLERFTQEHVSKLRPSTAVEYGSIIKEIVGEIGGLKVAGVEFADVDKLHRKITRRGAPYKANRVIAVLSKAFALAIKWKMRTDSPVKGVERNTESRRERYLTGDELDRLTAALGRYSNQTAADVFRLLLLTGARCGEVLGARWDQFDPDFAAWRKKADDTKQKKPHATPLSAPAQQILTRVWDSQKVRHTHVFPGIKRVQYAWEHIRADAGINDLRIHDLRHNFASALVNAGYQLTVIAKMLGHSRITTVERYSHLYPNTLQEAADKAGVLLTGKKTSAAVVPMRVRR
jgi:integrase